MSERTDLIESLIHPSLEDAAAAVHEDLTEIEEQLDKQLYRLKELAVLKKEKPGSSSLANFETDFLFSFF